MDYQSLLKVLWSALPRRKCATGGKVDGSRFAMPTSLRVEGAGDLALPLSGDGFLKLKAVAQQASYGKGEETLLDTDVRRAWQVEASKVSCPQIPDFFSKVVLAMASPVIEELGIDAAALGLDVRLYTLLLYEQGGHFKFHRDTEKEDGMFATMILQLPTQSGHEGGKLEIRHGKKKSVTLDFSGADSRTGYFQTAFFCDCEHKLAEVTSGTRLCLVFSLVRKFMDVDACKVPHYLSALASVQSQMKEWTENVKGTSSPILAIPLGHKYSKNSLGFAGLKGHDRVVAALVLSCKSFLDVYLCMLVKQTCTSNELYNTCETDLYSVANWTAIDDKKLEHFTSSSLSIKDQVVRDESNENDPFGNSPDKNVTHYGDNGSYTTSFYHTAALVVWPKDCRMEALCATQPVRCVVNWLEEQHKREPGRTSGDLERYVDALSNSQDTSFDEILLEFCIKHDFRDAAFSIMKKWGLELMETAAQDMVATVQKYGWDECYSGVIEGLLQEEDKKHGIVSFAEHLNANGLQEAGVFFAQKLLVEERVCESSLFLARLLGFFVKCGREDGAWKILGIAPPLPNSCLVQVVKKWGETSFPRIEEFWEKTLTEQEVLWKREAEQPGGGYEFISSETKKMKKLAALQQEGRRSFLGRVAAFVVELECRGCHNAAIALAKKRFIKDVDFEQIYGGLREIESADALVLLLGLDEKFHNTVKKVNNQELRDTVVEMKKAAGLFGLKKDEKVTQLFLELLSRALVYNSHNKELAEVAIWLGNEEMVESIVKRVRSGDFKLLEKEPFEKELLEYGSLYCKKTWDDIASLIEIAKRWDYVARDGLKKVINAKICYYEGVSSSNDVDEDEDEEEEKRKKRRKLNPRVERVKYEQSKESSGSDINRLRKLLVDLDCL